MWKKSEQSLHRTAECSWLFLLFLHLSTSPDPTSFTTYSSGWPIALAAALEAHNSTFNSSFSGLFTLNDRNQRERSWLGYHAILVNSALKDFNDKALILLLTRERNSSCFSVGSTKEREREIWSGSGASRSLSRSVCTFDELFVIRDISACNVSVAVGVGCPGLRCQFVSHTNIFEKRKTTHTPSTHA